MIQPGNRLRRLPVVAVLMATVACCCAAGWASAEDQRPLVLLEQKAFKSAVARVARSVVRIETIGGMDRVERVLMGSGVTTGLVVDAKGYVVSSAFGFVNKPTSILVRLPDGTRKPAQVVCADHNRMLVLLKIDVEQPLPVPEYAPRNSMRLGQWAIAVGRTFEADEPNVAIGIVSAVNRVWGKAIQTDAAVSPNNYGGPLIDVHGRVLGILAPMSPSADDEMAGIEWYDSGIGFAVVAEDVFGLLPRMKQGEDLQRGLIGISIRQKDLYTGEPIIAACQPRSPATEAGLQAGDRIVEISGNKIERASQIKEALGRLYAGDRVDLVVVREDGDQQQRLEKQIELVGELDPYQRPWLGILPLRDPPDEGEETGANASEGVGVRWVYPEGPAMAAGLQPGDVIRQCNGTRTSTAEALRSELLDATVGEEVEVSLLRGERELEVTIRLEPLPESPPPPELPPAQTTLTPAAEEKPAAGILPMQVAEWENNAWAYVPENYDPSVTYGLLIWLHGAGKFDHAEIVGRWSGVCKRNDLILLVPQASDPDRWHPDELEFVRKLLDQLVASYRIDGNRVVAGGSGAGGTLAYLLAFSNRDVIRGVATVDGPMIGPPPPGDPLRPLAVVVYAATDSRYAQLLRLTIERLREANYPVTVNSLGQRPRPLDGAERAQLGRWVDMLDRI